MGLWVSAKVDVLFAGTQPFLKINPCYIHCPLDGHKMLIENDKIIGNVCITKINLLELFQTIVQFQITPSCFELFQIIC